MNVKLTRKLSAAIDGIDLSQHWVGDVINLPDTEALILIAEGWAVCVDEAPAAPRDEPPPGSQRD